MVKGEGTGDWHKSVGLAPSLTMGLQVVTCVKLKYVQQPMGKTANGSSTIIRPSKRIIYDSTEAVVSFLSENVETCVAEFLEEWARVSKMVVIAREGDYLALQIISATI